jgi:hypothetical protein
VKALQQMSVDAGDIRYRAVLNFQTSLETQEKSR